MALINRALTLNPNLTAAWYASGWVTAFLGQTDLAIEHVARAMRLSPLDPLMFLMQTVALASGGLALCCRARHIQVEQDTRRCSP